MNSVLLNRITRYSPFLLSTVMLIAVIWNWVGNYSFSVNDLGRVDEGTLAHLFQIFSLLQVPIIVTFIMTSPEKSFKKMAPVVSLQMTFFAFVLFILYLSPFA